MRRGGRAETLAVAAAHSGFVAVETGGGFRGERFVDDLVAALVGSSAEAVELIDPDDAEDNAQSAVGIIHAPLVAGLRGWSDSVTARYREGKPTLVVLPAGVSGAALLRESVPPMLVTAASLLMTSADVVEALAEGAAVSEAVSGAAEVITSLGDGWPAWVDACLELIGSSADDQTVATIGSPSFRRRVAGLYLADFKRHNVTTLAQLAHFETFSSDVATALGGLDFAETVLPNAPGLMQTRTGLWRFVDPIRRQLTEAAALDPTSAEIIAPVLAADGELIAAVDALIKADLGERAAKLLDSLPGSMLDRCNQRELLGVLRIVRAKAPQRYSLGLKLARAHGNLQETKESIQACEIVVKLAQPESAIWLEAAAELLWHQHRTIDADDAEHQLTALRDNLAALPDSAPAGTRLREIEASILGQSPDPRTVQRGVDLMVEVAAEWEHQGERLRASRSMRLVAAGPLQHLGQYRIGQSLMAQAARLSNEESFDFGLSLTTKSRYDALCADREAFRDSYSQARAVIEPTGIGWLNALLHLSLAIDASWDGDATEIDRCFRAAKHLLGPAYEADAGVMLHCDMAVLLAVAGDIASARRALDDVRDRAELNSVEFSIAEIIVAARSGDAAEAERLCDVVDVTGLVPNDRRWRILLEIENASASPSSDVLTAIGHEVRRLDLSTLPRTLCPELFSHRSEQKTESIRVEVLGGFAVTDGSMPLAIPGSKVESLLKLLVISSGSASTETITDHLWPGVDVDTGIRRLRNVLKRAREALGANAVVRVADRIVLSDTITSDLEDFYAASRLSDANRTHDPAKARTAAITALDACAGPLLPDDLYSDQMNDARTAIVDEAMGLLRYVEQHQPNPVWLAETRRRITPTENAEAGGLERDHQL